MAKKYTAVDVARLAGVSIATVSRVATGSSRVSLEVVQRVQKAAADLGVNLNRRYKSRVIAFILSNREMLHPFHSHILVGAEACCSENGWSALFLRMVYSPSTRWRDLRIPRVLEQRKFVSGFIVAGTNYQNLLDRLEHEQVPFAVLGNNVMGEWSSRKNDVVWFDDIEGAIEITRYLQSLGHRDIWFVGNTRLPWFARRYRGYCQAMREAGLEVHLSEADSETDPDLGYLATKSLLAKKAPVTAIFAGGDLPAEGVYRALRDYGLHIPEDVSVAGFDDVVAALLHPPLSTVHVFGEQIGRKLAQMVLNRIEHPHLEFQHAIVPTRLVRRESCLPLTGAREGLTGANLTAG
ncbi:MAG TPA: LacI family DNA-binding transcriptional regulator [Terriglobia bacterium]|nr:LacI family DNA-binding transcriptional regulator [Terriglobia bacterium]